MKKDDKKNKLAWGIIKSIFIEFYLINQMK